jgi:hypothetical protein
MKRLLWSVLPVLAAALLAPGGARAGFMSINDTTSPLGTLTFSLNDFEGGFRINGNLVQQGLHNPATVTVPEAPQVTFTGSWIDLGLTPTANRTIFWTYTNAPGLVSDELTLHTSSGGGFGTISGTWLTNLNIPLPPGAMGIPEDGRTVDFSQPFLTAQAIAGDGILTPEPSTLALLGLGVIALVGWRRWRKRQRRKEVSTA